MIHDVAPGSPQEADWVDTQRRWTRGWRRLVLPIVFLAYLVFVGQAVARYSHGATAVAGYAVLGLFVLAYLGMLVAGWNTSFSEFYYSWPFWALYGVMAAAFVAEIPFARAAAFVMCLYLTAIAVGRFGGRATPLVLTLALAALFVPVAVPSWHDSFATAFNDVTPLAIPIVAIVTFAVVRVARGNQALVEARAEIARLAAENERSRIARDLHDLLGHSLTTITVKSALARRLGQSDPQRAAREMAQVEELSRRALGEVRATVAGYRDVTLVGELARGKELLRAAGVAADLPTAADAVDPANQELFGWAVREGLTNVARHAQASRCTVRLGADEVEIRDDGIGAPTGWGNGLVGLRDRVTAAGGTVEAGPLRPRGWRLRVTRPVVGSPVSP